MTCVKVSAADIIQFAGFFSSLRQTGASPGLTTTKRNQLKTFQWGRPDQSSCQTRWARNLPGFQLGNARQGVAFRCLMAGKEVKDKMMDRNGFTAEEATALIGAHTIGLTRNTFGTSLAGPWVSNGADNATPNGPVFDNAFFDFLDKKIPTSTAAQFQNDIRPFTSRFPDWFRDAPRDINHLDTDLALAFPTQNGGIHPDYHSFTVKFSNNNEVFLEAFFRSLGKMSKLGVRVGLSAPGVCDTCTGSQRKLDDLDPEEEEDAGDSSEDNEEEGTESEEEDEEQSMVDESEFVSASNDSFIAELEAAAEQAKILNAAKQIRREPEITKLTVPLEELKPVAADPDTQVVDVQAFEEERAVSADQADQFLMIKDIEHTSVLGNGVKAPSGGPSIVSDGDDDDGDDDA